VSRSTARSAASRRTCPSESGGRPRPIAIDERHQEPDATARPKQHDESIDEGRLRVKYRARQRSPGQRHADLVDPAGQDFETIEPGRVADQEQGVGCTTGPGSPGGTARCLPHRFGRGVHTDDQRLGPAARDVQHGTTIPGPQIHDQWPRASSQSLDLADVQFEDTAAHDATHAAHDTRQVRTLARRSATVPRLLAAPRPVLA